MDIRVIAVGKTNIGYIKTGMTQYEKRIQRYIPYRFETVEIPKKFAGLPAEKLKLEEGKAILKVLTQNDHVVLLDSKGVNLSSVRFAQFFQKKMNAGHKCVTFVIGGAYGFSEDVYQRARDIVSLSKMTFSHQLVRLILTEQVYRALDILNGGPYHHG